MIVRRLHPEERPDALRLAREVFLEFEAPEYSEEGVFEFLRYLEEEQRAQTLQMFGAFLGQELAGMIATTGQGHISLFFVAKQHHRKGIGRELFHALLRLGEEKRLTVNSSPYAVAVYRRLGFAEADCEQTENGIRYTPMVYPGQQLHSYLYLPCVWRAEGTYFDADGGSFALTGEVGLVREASRWTLGGWMEVATDPPVRFTNDYSIEETEHPLTLGWESFNPALGTLRGSFELIGRYVLSSYRSGDGRYSGSESLIRIDDVTYDNFGAVFDNGRKMSCWTARLTAVK